jgi:hypothetical protein
MALGKQIVTATSSGEAFSKKAVNRVHCLRHHPGLPLLSFRWESCYTVQNKKHPKGSNQKHPSPTPFCFVLFDITDLQLTRVK